MEHDFSMLTIGAFADAGGVNVETVRFYQRKGLLIEPKKPLGGIRRYGQVDVARLRFIKSAQRMGFSLDEVADLLRLEDGAHCQEARALAARKLDDVRGRLADLSRMERVLSDLVGACESSKGSVDCPVIASLREEG